MFHSARLKLTAWYLLIIMLISAFFSVVIYVGMAGELQRGFHRAELRMKAEELGIHLPQRFSDRPEDLPPRLRGVTPRFLFVEDLEVAKRRLVFNLLTVNGAILVFSAGAGYFLAGKTLRPIERAMEEQKKFVADASHELRTPLTALKTSMEVALRDKKMSLREARKVIKSNLEDVDSLRLLSDNLLNLTNYQTNGRSLIFEEVDMAEIVKNASRKIRPLAKKKEIDLRIAVKKQAFQVNKEALEKMIIIFLDNAIKYTPKGGKVTVSSRKEKKHLVLEIKDTGIGIAKRDLPHIFDRFYRADQSRSKTRADGFGLGLSLAKKIIDLHRGSVKVSSEVGKSTIFTIRLPLLHKELRA